jgi:hypothetical protein
MSKRPLGVPFLRWLTQDSWAVLGAFLLAALVKAGLLKAVPW